jgi:hypothetical protein
MQTELNFEEAKVISSPLAVRKARAGMMGMSGIVVDLFLYLESERMSKLLDEYSNTKYTFLAMFDEENNCEITCYELKGASNYTPNVYREWYENHKLWFRASSTYAVPVPPYKYEAYVSYFSDYVPKVSIDLSEIVFTLSISKKEYQT